jgi:hypothetical protein
MLVVGIKLVEGIMKLFLILTFVINLPLLGHTEMKVSDFIDSSGSAKIFWKDMTEDQKAQDLEWEKDSAEYILNNLDKKCSELKNIPEYTRLYEMQSFTIPPKTFGPNDICFPSSSQIRIHAYRTLGDHENELAEMRRSHGLNPERMADLLVVLISEGYYREAEAFFPEFVHAVCPLLTKEDVVEKIKNREAIPSYLSKGLVAEFWDKILEVQDKRDDLMKRYKEEKLELSERMHRYFYSKDAVKKAKALEFYREKKIKFMIEKAHNTWKGAMKIKADKYLEELLRSAVIASSQGATNKKMEIIRKLNSRNDEVIFKGYELLVNNDGRVIPEYRDDIKIKDSLWNALKFLVPEPAEIKPVESETNNTADYLLYIMGDVRETRAIPYLMKNIHFGGFQDSLARMGDKAVDPALTMLESANMIDKEIAVRVLEAMLAPKPKEIKISYIDPVKGLSYKTIANSSCGLYEASGEAREKIKLALKKQLHMTPVNLFVLSAYKYAADEEDIKLLEDIAHNDPYKKGVYKRDAAGTIYKDQERYPFREEAQKALDYIRRKKSNVQAGEDDVHTSTAAR